MSEAVSEVSNESYVGPEFSTQFLVLGDWGSTNASLIGNARHMTNLFEAKNLTDHFYVVCVGDNFYPCGVRRDDDLQWDNHFIKNFARIQCPWFPALGNHDYDGNPDVQVQFKRDWRWQMDGRYYSKVIGNVQIIILDTVQLCPEHTLSVVGFGRQVIDGDARDIQLAWLADILKASTAEWRIVFGSYNISFFIVSGLTSLLFDIPGHYPIYTGGSYRTQTSEMRPIEKILRDNDVGK